jgi:putative oxidoreductase
MKAYGLTLLRVTVGALYLLQAYRLLTVVTPPGTAGFVSRAFGLPHPGILAWILIAACGLGGLMLMAGVLTRGAAAANALIAGVVLVRVHVPPHDVLRGGSTLIQSAPAGGFEYGVLLTVATVVVLMLGSGPLALRPSK